MDGLAKERYSHISNLETTLGSCTVLYDRQTHTDPKPQRGRQKAEVQVFGTPQDVGSKKRQKLFRSLGGLATFYKSNNNNKSIENFSI